MYEARMSQIKLRTDNFVHNYQIIISSVIMMDIWLLVIIEDYTVIKNYWQI